MTARGLVAPCLRCLIPFLRTRSCKRYCSDACRLAAHAARHNKDPRRPCRVCGAVFVRVGQGHANKQHCSLTCAAESARASRAKFYRRNPDRVATYRARAKAKASRDTGLARLWKKYPELPRACEACGESRVLDIAHRPEHRRNGAWRTMANTTPLTIWVLCPTCHALLDRLGHSAEQLGIKPRQSEAA